MNQCSKRPLAVRNVSCSNFLINHAVIRDIRK
jgi:hypothetical protein